MLKKDVLRALAAAPWAVVPEYLAEILAAADAAVTERMRRDSPGTLVRGAVAVLPIYGLLKKRGGGLLSAIYGGADTETLSAALHELGDDPAVGAIVLDVDSPGGSVYGVQETAALLRQVAAVKPVFAVANSLAASGAYWIASAVGRGRFFASPSADVGAIGVYVLHLDMSSALEEAGIKPTFVFAGEHKVEGNWYEPLSDEARTHLQSIVDETYTDFVASVAQGRNMTPEAVRAGFGQGRIVGARQALASGMVDGIATLADVVSLAAAEAQALGRRTASNPSRLGSALLAQRLAESSRPLEA